MEIAKFAPDVTVHPLACPIWVPLVEYGEYDSEGADYFVKKYLDQLLSQSPDIDTILLACTHYPLLMDKIKKHVPEGISIISQGEIVAESMEKYLERHPEMENRLTHNGTMEFYTTDDPDDFNEHATYFFGREVRSQYLKV
jgi:glutamate racemase